MPGRLEMKHLAHLDAAPISSARAAYVVHDEVRPGDRPGEAE